MGLSSKLVSSDGIEYHDWSGNRAVSRDHEAVSDDHQVPRSCPVKRKLPQDGVLDQPEPVKCPRCESTNTKFCYFNNYNKSQPRHFCKACKRHWTKGGILRNVPVGGSRKNKRLKTASTATAASVSTTVGVANHSEPTVIKNEIFAGSDIGDSILTCMPHQDILDLLQFPVSSLSESMITSCSVPMTWQPGFGDEATASSFWSWADIESLVSTSQGLAWDDPKMQLS